uniref:Spt6 SH2 domain-containing protein n=1 Tax=Panagrolaimus davidi TaxID=227884 RepID=A0A914PI73_9BILA
MIIWLVKKQQIQEEFRKFLFFGLKHILPYTCFRYCFTVSAKYPGKFLLSYGKNHHEYITLTPNGLEFRKQPFPDVNTLINWFKQNFREVPVGRPMASSRPLPSAGGHRPPPQQQRPSRFGR